ncbi:MAG: P-loop NTPase family protein, partial [Solirubrobacteraceae bacterium]
MPTRDEVIPVGPPVALEYQIGRNSDIERLRLSLGQHGEDIVLVDVRRTGKTTVALCALEELSAAGHVVLSIDARANAPATVDLAQRLAQQLAAHESGALSAIRNSGQMLRTLYEHGRGAIGLIDNAQLRTALDTILPATLTGTPGTDQLAHVLDRADAIAAARGVRSIVFIDEVQAISEWPDGPALQSLLRERLRRAGGHIGYLFAGSEPTAVQTLFRRDGALDFQGIEHHLDQITGAAWFEGLMRAFRLLGASIDEAAIDTILDASEGHPVRTMLAARETHARAEMARPPAHATRGIATLAVDAAKRQRLWAI